MSSIAMERRREFGNFPASPVWIDMTLTRQEESLFERLLEASWDRLLTHDPFVDWYRRHVHDIDAMVGNMLNFEDRSNLAFRKFARSNSVCAYVPTSQWPKDASAAPLMDEVLTTFIRKVAEVRQIEPPLLPSPAGRETHR